MNERSGSRCEVPNGLKIKMQISAKCVYVCYGATHRLRHKRGRTIPSAAKCIFQFVRKSKQFQCKMQPIFVQMFDVWTHYFLLMKRCSVCVFVCLCAQSGRAACYCSSRLTNRETDNFVCFLFRFAWIAWSTSHNKTLLFQRSWRFMHKNTKNKNKLILSNDRWVAATVGYGISDCYLIVSNFIRILLEI